MAANCRISARRNTITYGAAAAAAADSATPDDVVIATRLDKTQDRDRRAATNRH